MPTVLCYSGGLDSTVLLYDALSQGEEVACLGVAYGQTHKRELEGAESLCDALGVPYHRVGVGPTSIFDGSALTGSSQGTVVVPNRNMVLLSLAGALAESLRYDTVAIAAHQGDYDLFPDCRPSFFEEMYRAFRRATDGRVRLWYPYVRLSKLDIVKRGIDLEVPFDLTWSCYGPGPEPCGECLACRERREAFLLAGAPA